jgi:hypothetical protein
MVIVEAIKRFMTMQSVTKNDKNFTCVTTLFHYGVKIFPFYGKSIDNVGYIIFTKHIINALCL